MSIGDSEGLTPLNEDYTETDIMDHLEFEDNHFIKNEGQKNPIEVLFYSSGEYVYFTSKAVYYRLKKTESCPHSDLKMDSLPDINKVRLIEHREKGVILKYEFKNSNYVMPKGKSRCGWNSNYFLGNDENGWRTNVPNFEEVIYEDLWNGIDLIYRLKDGSIKYDLVVDAGADPEQICFGISGHESLDLNLNGDLLIGTEMGMVIDRGLIAFSGNDESIKINCKFKIMDRDTIMFDVGQYDKREMLIIDPIMDFSTFVGGSGQDNTHDLATDPSGNIYVMGYTSATGFPITTGAYDTTFNGKDDTFIYKMDRNGTSLLYSTYIGGSGGDYGNSITLDDNGNLYLVGDSWSTNFPTTSGAYDTTHNGLHDAIVTKFNSTGSGLIFSTYIGGSVNDMGFGIELDDAHNIYIAGAGGPGYPTTTGAYDTSHNGNWDAIITKLSSNGTTLDYSSFIGGSDADGCNGIAFDSGNTILTDCFTKSNDFPTTLNAYDTTFNGMQDIAIVEMNLNNGSLSYSSYVGGSAHDIAVGVVFDSSGDVLFYGYSNSTDYPVTDNSYDNTSNGSNDVIITIFDLANSTLLNSTYVGGSADDSANDLLIDKDGSLYLAGKTRSSNFPVTNGAYDTSHNGLDDIFLSKLDPNLSSMEYSTFIGGSSWDRASGVKCGKKDSILIAGAVSSSNFPVTTGSYDTSHNGNYDTSVTSLSFEKNKPSIIDETDQKASTGDPFSFKANVTDPDSGVGNVSVEYWIDGIRLNTTMSQSSGIFFKNTVINNKARILNYTIHASDKAGNWNQTEMRSINVEDNDDPVIQDDSLTTGTTGEVFQCNFSVTDNIGIESVWLEYWMGNGPHSNLSVGSSGLYKINISIGSDSLDPLSYVIHSNDTSGNWFSTDQRTVNISDNDPVIFGNDLTPGHGSTGGSLSFSVEAFDNIHIQSIWVEYWSGTGPHMNISMSGPGPFEHNMEIPSSSVDPVHYIFSANDSSNNWNSTPEKTVQIIDDDPASFDLDLTPSTGSTGDEFIFMVQLSDNIKIESVWVEYWFGSGPHENITMEDDGEYTYIITIPEDSLDVLRYIFRVKDISNNWNESKISIVEIIDNDKPSFGQDNILQEIGTGETLSFSIHSYDNIQVSSVHLEYWFGSGGHEKVKMIGSNPYNYDVTIPKNSLDGLNYNITSRDDAGNMISNFGEIVIMDTIRPKCDPGSDRSFNEDGYSILDGLGSTDNINVVNWTWEFNDENKYVKLFGPETRYIFKEPGIYRIKLTVTDYAGNWCDGYSNITILDITPPIAKMDDMEISEDVPFQLDGSASIDNIGIVNWTWSLKDKGNTILLYGIGPSFTIDDPGLYQMSLIVEDSSGNKNESTFDLVVLDTTDPVSVAGQNITIKEGTELSLDGTGSWDNLLIINYTWTIITETGSMTLFGDIIQFNFSETGNYSITLTTRDESGNTGTDTFFVKVEDIKGPETEDTEKNSGSGSNLPWIIVVIFLILIILIAGSIIFIVKKRNQKDGISENDEVSSQLSTDNNNPP